MREIESKNQAESSSRTWIAVLIATAAFLFWTLFIFYTVGVKWPPAWDFGALPDVPGLSVYSTHPPKPGPLQGAAPLLQGGKLMPQHVKDPTAQFTKKEHTE